MKKNKIIAKLLVSGICSIGVIAITTPLLLTNNCNIDNKKNIVENSLSNNITTYSNNVNNKGFPRYYFTN